MCSLMKFVPCREASSPDRIVLVFAQVTYCRCRVARCARCSVPEGLGECFGASATTAADVVDNVLGHLEVLRAAREGRSEPSSVVNGNVVRCALLLLQLLHRRQTAVAKWAGHRPEPVSSEL